MMQKRGACIICGGEKFGEKKETFKPTIFD